MLVWQVKKNQTSLTFLVFFSILCICLSISVYFKTLGFQSCAVKAVFSFAGRILG